MKKKANAQSLRAVFGNIWYLYKICWKSAPGFMVLSMLEYIRNEIVVFLEFTFGFNYVLECAEFGRSYKEAAIFLICLLTFTALGLLFGACVFQRVQMKAMPRMKQALKKELYKKAKELDLAAYDDPKFYNEFVLSVAEADNQVDRLSSMMSAFFTGLTSICCNGVFFLTKDGVSLLFVLASFFTTLLMGRLINNRRVKMRMEKNPLERKAGYINRCYYLNDYAKELRLNSNASDILMKEFDDTMEKSMVIEKKNCRPMLWLNYVDRYLSNSFLLDTLYMIYLVLSAAVWHRISYSNVAVMYNTSGMLKNRMTSISQLYPQALEVSVYMEKIKRFLLIEPKIVSLGDRQMPEHPTRLELRHVSFGYQENESYILDDINMTFEPYSKTALVGYNGAGKTTLIKLIMRLYDPNEGEILLDGVNIKEYPLEDYRRKIGTVFQDFKIFAATVRENVLLDFAEHGDENRIREAIAKAGFTERLDTLGSGLDTPLTTEFEEDGVNLSGGESQKLAISRVFYKDANLIILDEPSSALDPIAEYNLNHSMLSAAEHKTVVFISHRLSTTRIADRIYMLEKGRLIEQGTHEELLSKEGRYAEMWHVQASHYLAQ